MPKHHKVNVELSVYEIYLLEDALQDHVGDLQHAAQLAQLEKKKTDRAEMLVIRAREASELRTKLDQIKRARLAQKNLDRTQ